jgi:hypothetical protein
MTRHVQPILIHISNSKHWKHRKQVYGKESLQIHFICIRKLYKMVFINFQFSYDQDFKISFSKKKKKNRPYIFTRYFTKIYILFLNLEDNNFQNKPNRTKLNAFHLHYTVATYWQYKKYTKQTTTQKSRRKLCHPIGTFAIPCKYQQDLRIEPTEWTATPSTRADVLQMPRWSKWPGRKPAVTLKPEPHQYRVFTKKNHYWTVQTLTLTEPTPMCNCKYTNNTVI